MPASRVALLRSAEYAKYANKDESISCVSLIARVHISMDKAEIIKHIEDLGLVPVVRASSADEAMQVIDAIKAGGVNVLEITMTVPGAVKVIEKVADKYGSEVLRRCRNGA